MFQRIVSLLLCTCLIAGSVPETAYAASMTAATQTMVQTENAFAETEEVSEVDEGATEGGETEDGETEDEETEDGNNPGRS